MATTTYVVNKRPFTFSTNSRAQELYDSKKFDELSKHLLAVEAEAKKLQGNPAAAIANLRETMAARGFAIPS